MPIAAFDRAGVALDEAKRRDRQSEEIGGDLREAGLMALAVRLRAEHQRDTAAGLEADLCALAWRAARGSEKTDDAEAPQPAARGRPAGAPAGRAMHRFGPRLAPPRLSSQNAS